MTARRLIPIAVAVLVAAGAALLYQDWGDEPEEETYLTAPVERGPIAVRVTATGVVNALATVQVGTYVSGPIIAIDVDFNSVVRKGQRVARIDPAPFRVKVRRAEASVANARATVQKARADLSLKQLTLDRYRDLRSKDYVSQSDLDGAKNDYDQAEAQLALALAGVQQAEADLADARINLDYTDITSPVDGVVVSRSVDVGQTVAASFQTPTLFQIAQDLAQMQVIGSVSESDIADLREGQEAEFGVDAFPDRVFRGKVTQVRNAPVTVQNVVTYDVVIEVDNRDLSLKPGMTASVSVTTAEKESALKVPIRALGFDPDRGDGEVRTGKRAPAPRGDAVWRLEADGSPHRIPVEAGLRDDAFVEISSDEIREGDTVIVGLRHGPKRKEAARLLGVPRMR